jgi:hypothetical protein
MSLIGNAVAVDRPGNSRSAQNAGVTVVRALRPRNVGKSFDLVEGRLVKTSAGKLSLAACNMHRRYGQLCRSRQATNENGVFVLRFGSRRSPSSSW